MLAAALVPAGYLWSTEFGAYDALSYHLQSPREWLASGAMRPLPHLAYAGLPSFVEGAFMHLMALRADAREAAIACQLLHACMALTAAATLREAVRVPVLTGLPFGHVPTKVSLPVGRRATLLVQGVEVLLGW